MPFTEIGYYTGTPSATRHRTLGTVVDVAGAFIPAPADPETEPEAIAEAQRRDVSAAWRLFRTGTPEERVARVSEEVMLCPWIVRRRLGELGYDIAEPTTNADRLAAKIKLEVQLLADLRANGPGTAAEVAKRIGKSAENTGHTVQTLRKLAVMGKVKMTGRRLIKGFRQRSTPIFSIV